MFSKWNRLSLEDGNSVKPLHPVVLGPVSYSARPVITGDRPKWIGIGVSAAGLVIALVGFALGRAGIESGETLAREHRFGSGPYTRSNCHPNEPILKELLSTANEIRHLAKEHPNKFNWAPFDEAFVESNEQTQAQDFTNAFQNIAKAITFIMSEFRK